MGSAASSAPAPVCAAYAVSRWRFAALRSAMSRTVRSATLSNISTEREHGREHEHRPGREREHEHEHEHRPGREHECKREQDAYSRTEDAVC